jgi:hypothetical protein
LFLTLRSGRSSRDVPCYVRFLTLVGRGRVWTNGDNLWKDVVTTKQEQLIGKC